MNIYFYILIFITGALTCRTDIYQYKVKNKHLALIWAGAIILYLMLFITGNLKPSALLLLNPLAGIMVALILYRIGIFKGGDAKLFLTYSMLLPENRIQDILPFSCFSLFLIAFLLSLLYILPSLLASIIQSYKQIIKELFSKNTSIYLLKIFLITFSISWLITPALRIISPKNNVFLNFILLFLGYRYIMKAIVNIKFKLALISFFLAANILKYK